MFSFQNPDLLKGKIDKWAKAIAGTRPMRIPVYPVGPAGRSIFNAQDFAKQHGCSVVYGWIIETSETMSLLRAEYYGVVRFHTRTFSITAMGEEDELLFFEDPGRIPIIHTRGRAEIMYSYHKMVWPEQQPGRHMIVVDPEFKEPVQIPMPENSRPRIIHHAPPAARPSAYKYSERNREADEQAEVHAMVQQRFKGFGQH